jgi:hypothetical protein
LDLAALVWVRRRRRCAATLFSPGAARGKAVAERFGFELMHCQNDELELAMAGRVRPKKSPVALSVFDLCFILASLGLSDQPRAKTGRLTRRARLFGFATSEFRAA